jgi:CRISPR-associated exonuclease Cas4
MPKSSATTQHEWGDPVDPVPLSALQHWCYCPRQCGLIHLEQVFQENVHTLRGRAVHARVDAPGVEIRSGLRVERALPVFSDRLGLVGRADTVEFEADGTPFPVEYKHGSRHKAAAIAACDDIQLAGQALCLEEMTGRDVPAGAIFYATSKRRRNVAIDTPLRDAVMAAADAIRRMLRSGVVPMPTTDETRCRGCSLKGVCQPEAVSMLTTEPARLSSLFDPDT